MMNVKKLLAILTALVMAACLFAGCSTSAKSEETSETTTTAATKHIYVLTPTESTGWTGSVATFAKVTIEEINAEGTYTAELLTAATGDEQNNQLEDIATNSDPANVAVVILPYDDTVERGIQAVIDAGIQYVAFDRLIASVSDKAVANVKGDNEGVGAACAYYLVEQGLQPADTVFVFEGDTSSVTTDRKAGFEAYLKGEMSYNGNTIGTAWTDSDLDSLVSSGSLTWSQTEAQAWFETLMSDAGNASVKYLCAFDDSFIIGVMDALSGSAISDDIKATFLGGKPVITGCGGAENVYEILRGESEYQSIADQFGGIMSTTYSPSMIQTAIGLMINYLNGDTVEQDYVIATEIVDSSNATEYVGFE
jgi:ribose transport system substrate-binding protein